MAIKCLIPIAILGITLCMTRSNTSDPPKYSPVLVAFDPVISDDAQDQYKFGLSGCVSSNKDGVPTKGGPISFTVPEKIKTGSVCLFQITAAPDKQKELERNGYRWKQTPGLLYQDDSVAVSVEADGSRKGISRDLLSQFDAPNVIPSGKSGSITAKITVPIDNFQPDQVEGRIDCIPPTPYQGSLKTLTSKSDGLTEYQLQVAVNLPDDGKDSVTYSCGIIRLFKDKKMIAMGVTDKAYSIRITSNERDQTLPVTTKLLTSFPTDSSVNVDPQLKPKP